MLTTTTERCLVDHRYIFRSVKTGACERQYDSSDMQESNAVHKKVYDVYLRENMLRVTPDKRFATKKYGAGHVLQLILKAAYGTQKVENPEDRVYFSYFCLLCAKRKADITESPRGMPILYQYTIQTHYTKPINRRIWCKRFKFLWNNEWSLTTTNLYA